MNQRFILSGGSRKGLPGPFSQPGESPPAFQTGLGGFSPLTDFSDLALFHLNDQLERLWQKEGLKRESLSDAETLLLNRAALVDPGIGGRPYYREEQVTYYVSGEGNDAQDGLTQETPFRTIHRALSALPLFLGQRAVIRVEPSGSPLMEYPWFLGPFTGEVEVMATRPGTPLWGGIRLGPCVRGCIRLKGFAFQCPLEVGIENRSPGALLLLENCTVTMNGGEGGVGVLANGGKIGVTGCTIMGATKAALLSRNMGEMAVYQCSGQDNGVGALSETGGVIRLSGTLPDAGRLTQSVSGGMVTGTVQAAKKEAPGSMGMHLAEFSSDLTFSALGNTFLPDDAPAQGRDLATGEGYRGYWRFPEQEIAPLLSGKTMLGGQLFLTRKPGIGPNKRTKPYLYLHGHRGPQEPVARVNAPLGESVALFPGESAWVTVPPSSLSMLATGSATGYAVYSPEQGEEMEFFDNATRPVRLWVLYRG